MIMVRLIPYFRIASCPALTNEWVALASKRLNDTAPRRRSAVRGSNCRHEARSNPEGACPRAPVMGTNIEPGVSKVPPRGES